MPRGQTGQGLTEDQKSFLEVLKARPKKKILIPEDPNNPDDVVPVGINGVIYAIPRGREFEVPDVIYDVWKESYDRTMAAQRRIRVTEKKDLVIHS